MAITRVKIEAKDIVYQIENLLFDIFKSNLYKLHEHDYDTDQVFTRLTDQSTKWHRLFYENFESLIQPLYESLIDCLTDIFDMPLVYQRVPTFRVHYPENVAVGEWHKDSDYQHSTDEINIWVPLTDAYETATVWVRDQDQEFALNSTLGDAWIFDAANLEHGNKINRTGLTRVSFDFRVIPEHLYKDSDHKSINTGLEFKRGGYFA